MTTPDYQEQFKTWMDEWKQRFEEMQQQFIHGKTDATDFFEKQKDYLRNALLQLKKSTDKLSGITEEQMEKVKTIMEELQVQLALGKADGKDLFMEQKKKIEGQLDELLALGKSNYHQGFVKAMEMFDYHAGTFKTGLEIARLQFTLARMDAHDDAEKLRKELQHKIAELQQLFVKGQFILADQMTEWNRQWLSGLDRMKTWAGQWQK